jgi:hypothetical protein
MLLLRHSGSRATLVLASTSIASLLVACGGKVVVDAESAPGTGGTAATTSTTSPVGAGGAGTSGTSGGTSSTTGGGGCGGLQADLEAKVAAAQACNPAVSSPQCSGALTVLDLCGCTVVANEKTPAATQTALEAFKAWVGVGCGPFACESCPPGPDTPWYCDSNKNICMPAFEK